MLNNQHLALINDCLASVRLLAHSSAPRGILECAGYVLRKRWRMVSLVTMTLTSFL
jgi:hypothetical protein